MILRKLQRLKAEVWCIPIGQAKALEGLNVVLKLQIFPLIQRDLLLWRCINTLLQILSYH